MAGDPLATMGPISTATSSDRGIDPDPELLASVDGVDLSQALTNIDIPLFIWDESGQIELANSSAADLVGRSLGELVGTMLTDYVSPAPIIEKLISSMVAGQIDAMKSRRTLRDGNGRDVPVLAISKAIGVDGRRGGITMFVPRVEVGRVGRDPVSRAELVPVSVGVATRDWVITAISAEVRQLLNRAPEHCVGQRLLSFVHPDDLLLLSQVDHVPPAAPVTYPRIRFGFGDGSWREIGLLVAPRGEAGALLRFALVGNMDDFLPSNADRVEELELRLRRIGAEVRAAGFIDLMDPRVDLTEFPQLGELTTRQWEILNRLLDGDRVATIASDLYISRSTVRNHLATIFSKFDVHSQPELIELLRRSKG